MAIEVIQVQCPRCGTQFPSVSGSAIRCPSCGVSDKIAGVTIPDAFLWFPLGILAGIILVKSKWVAGKVSKF
jgi:hypothetical protein